ncbi:hypothetical protein CBM2585_B50123 [Cupriavidus taiwanensis]|nr:hypothetical protein CBM2585_B50123 [Cupriavidus taiwanensis]
MVCEWIRGTSGTMRTLHAFAQANH